MTTMKLKNYLKQNSPFNTKEDVDSLFAFLKERNIHVDEIIKNKLMTQCSDTVIPYLDELLKAYMPNDQLRPSNPKKKKKKMNRYKPRKKWNGITNFDSKSSRDYFKRVSPDSLAVNGYEYGLSDW